MCQIAINASSQQGNCEIEVSGTHVEFANVAKQLQGFTGGIFLLKHKPEMHYPTPMRQVVIEAVGHSHGVVTALIEEEVFRLLGDKHAFQKVSEFVASLSNLSIGEHFHLDWFANEDLLAPATANMSFVFFMEAEA